MHTHFIQSERRVRQRERERDEITNLVGFISWHKGKISVFRVQSTSERGMMQRWTRNGMLNFSEPSSPSPFGGFVYGSGQRASARSRRPQGCRGQQDKEQRNLQKNLSKVRKEWMNVKEEMGYARLLSEHLTETLTEADRKVSAMLEELDRTDKYMQDILSQQHMNQP